MADIDLAQKFPDMRPLKSAPTLSTSPGFGLRLRGRRDHDAETNSYVITHTFVFLYLPLINVGAFRVIDTNEGGWYILGRVPLSGKAKLWNFGFIAALLALAGAGTWAWYTSTPDYKASQQIAKADKLVEEGKAGEAAKIYAEEMKKPTKHAGTARDKLRGLVEKPPEKLNEAAEVFRIALDEQRQNNPLVPDLFERGRDLANAKADSDPRGALAVIETVAPLAPDLRDLLAAKEKLLERLVAENPNDPDLVSQFAVVLESKGDLARCEKLLHPLADRLGTLDGAAILGRIYGEKGNLEAALRLLEPFVQNRLAQLQAAASALEATSMQVEQQIIAELNDGKAAGFDTEAVRKLPMQQQRDMVEEYLVRRLRDDPQVRASQQQLAQHRGVVTAALDLGMFQLQRGQQLADPAARKQSLEAAEKTFLSIRSVAGNAQRVQLNLGQVYHWLGRPNDAKKVFDEMLAGSNRDAPSLLLVADVLREIGDTSEARKLAEESFNKATDAQIKHEAAHHRALMFKDVDDQILWLDRCDHKLPNIRASLSQARGHKAQADGREQEAATLFRSAIETYQQMPETGASLNNCALVLFALHRVTNERDVFVRGMDMIERAVQLRQGDSILLHNAASVILTAAIEDVMAKHLDFKLIKSRGGFELFAFAYRDAAGKQAIVDEFRKHPGTLKARSYFEKLMILSPKRDDAYALLYRIHNTTRDADALKALRERLEKTSLDLEQEKQEVRDFWAGTNDDKKKEEVRKLMERDEAALPAARKHGGVTFAVAAYNLNRWRYAQALMGTPVDFDGIVKLAEEAHQTAPSEGTRSGLAMALTQRAHIKLIKEDRDYAAMGTKTSRSIGPRIIDYVLLNGGTANDKARLDPDLKRAAQLRVEQWRSVPHNRSFASWALVQAFEPMVAAEMAAAIRADPVDEIERSIEMTLLPLSGGVAMDGYVALRLAGKDTAATDFLKECAKRGVPVPDVN